MMCLIGGCAEIHHRERYIIVHAHQVHRYNSQSCTVQRKGSNRCQRQNNRVQNTTECVKGTLTYMHLEQGGKTLGIFDNFVSRVLTSNQKMIDLKCIVVFVEQ